MYPKKVLKALKASIKHWEDNLAAERSSGASCYPQDCALCMLFNYPPGSSECGSCPVSEKSGKPYCKKTPFWEAEKALDGWADGKGLRATFRRHAQKEVDFLKSLLPPEEQGGS